ncbi:unnamed protein product [Cyprideis torosa]|uniref:Tetrapyrrole methylase domain-containing protein n=1 Tax=Cyprideis torosa TaxID=163714 RepID=A0A7R8ZUK6_9CRUS|nr:unnamed protein product [Cyprideis torosa]CAG0909119.1 unnamed protein product [Cyprideis torosa]
MMTHPIHFVGAGPGDPELITVKGRRLLRQADIIVYTGSLVPKALLDETKAKVHDSAGLNLDQVIDILTQGWEKGLRVVRLHTGDPAIYGAINEQLAILRSRQIPCHIIPGVSSATAAAAALGTELTLPEVSQTVIITRREGRTPVPAKEGLTHLATHGATMLILLSISMIDEVVKDLLDGGYEESTPVAVVEKVSWPEERRILGNLGNIGEKVHQAGIRKTAIIVVGKVLDSNPLEKPSKLYDRGFSHEYRQGEK